ncbi:unnamed protein product [Brachionus calyciflorus]|uniref:Uncharacterized protein n=1 Tax=Brachionus calyciflorus TaxID=104777 RepID=A0A813NZM0_9BILA|nr:unnamed protein product [Brachionus calyciflorus]
MFDQMDNEKLFAIKLADNEKTIRDKSISQLRNYIRSRCITEKSPFSEEDLIKLWKGLHYCMWMCDKPLVQEELNDKICNLMDCFNNNNKQVILFVKVYFMTIIREWIGIDKWRMDKFMMLVRSIIRKIFGYLNSKKWDKVLIKKFNKMMLELPLNINDDRIPDGITYHITDLYIEELAKFGDNIKPVRAVKMLLPFFKLMAISKKPQFVMHLKKRLFEQIIECSDVGIEPEVEEEMAEIKAFGLQLCEEEDTSEYNIKFNYKLIADKLFKVGNSQECLQRNKKLIFDLVKKFRALMKGVYPIDDFNLPNLDKDDERTKPNLALLKKKADRIDLKNLNKKNKKNKAKKNK